MIVLDTHVWLSDPGRLPDRARRAVTEADDDRAVYVEALPSLRFVPVDNSIAVRSVRLTEPFHSDPADRIIGATAIMMGAPVVSGDAKIGNYPYVTSTWN